MKASKLPFLMKNHLIDYPTPMNMNYNWSFGALSGVFAGIQLMTGILLAIHYVSSIEIVFENMEHMMSDVNNGWLLSYMHANSASFFFMCMYLHIFSGIFYKSYMYPSNFIWNSGVIMLVLSMIVAFIGYVLPWGQMSYWGATVMTNPVTALPYIGSKLVLWIWGGFTVQGSTMISFYNFHYLFAMMLLILMMVHISLLHEVGSSNPLGIMNVKDKAKFYRYFFLKDLFMLFAFFCLYMFMLMFYPNLLGHSDNYMKANSLVTPTHIVPEWYFLPFYAMLRSIDNKLLGVVAMLVSLLILLILPLCSTYIKIVNFNMGITDNLFFIFFFFLMVGLWFMGALPAEYPYMMFGKVLTFLYFVLFLVNYIYSKFLSGMMKFL